VADVVHHSLLPVERSSPFVVPPRLDLARDPSRGVSPANVAGTIGGIVKHARFA
jgi:hypothetical protein